MTSDQLNDLAARYAKAWCSHNPESVAAFFAENGSVRVNNDAPAVGRAAIAAVARGFMRDLPNMTVKFDRLEPRGDAIAFHWTLIGTNPGPRGTGHRVQISGYELWRIGNNGLIAESKGNFDSSEYERQLTHGLEP